MASLPAPGALVGTCLMFTAYTIARRHGYKGTMHSYTMAEFGRALLKNIWSLMAPVVILGGIYAGICTPVEASVVAVWYALFVGFFITKKLSLKEVFNAMKLANISTGRGFHGERRFGRGRGSHGVRIH